MVTDYHRQLIDDAWKHPLPLRIAQLLVADGITEEVAIKQLNSRHPLESQIINHIRDIERGQFLNGQNPKRLNKLAEQLR